MAEESGTGIPDWLRLAKIDFEQATRNIRKVQCLEETRRAKKHPAERLASNRVLTFSFRFKRERLRVDVLADDWLHHFRVAFDSQNNRAFFHAVHAARNDRQHLPSIG